MAPASSAAGSLQTPVTGHDQVLQRLRQHDPQLEAEFPLASLEPFCSFARDEQRADSDGDLIVAFSAPVGFASLNLVDRPENLLGRRVDLVAADGIKPNRWPFIRRACLHVNRDWRLCVDDMLETITRINRYTADADFEDCSQDERTIDAVAHHLEIVGEAARRSPDDVNAESHDIA